MARYCLDQRVEPMTGKNEVHAETCHAQPMGMTREDLGDHATCENAVAEAQRRHRTWRIHGCRYCARSCHTP